MNIGAGRCRLCKKIMNRAKGCDVKTVFCNGKQFTRIKAVEDCDECGAKTGHYHHYGCDQEVCPSCRQQLLSCGCEGVGFLFKKEVKTQEELVKDFQWLNLNWKEWEISLVTEKHVFCSHLKEEEALLKVYKREDESIEDNVGEPTEFYEHILLSTFISGTPYEYMSEKSEKCLTLLKEELLKRLSEGE